MPVIKANAYGIGMKNIIPILNEENMVMGEYHLLIGTQGFCECYKEKCAAWDKEKQMCRKEGNQ